MNLSTKYNNIKNNAISVIDAKKSLKTLIKIQNAELTKYKICTSAQQELLDLFNDLLKTILIDKMLMPSKDDYNGNKNDNKNDNENKNKYEKKNDNENEHDSDNENDNDSDNKNENENENDNYNYNKTKELNDSLDKMVDESKSFEEQIKLFKKVKNLDEYWHSRCFGGKELKFKIFKANLANCSNFIDEELFAKIFGYTLATLANKLMNTTNKEENQIIVNDIEKNKNKLFEEDDHGDYVIQPSDRRLDLIDAINLILDFNKRIQLDLV